MFFGAQSVRVGSPGAASAGSPTSAPETASTAPAATAVARRECSVCSKGGTSPTAADPIVCSIYRRECAAFGCPRSGTLRIGVVSRSRLRVMSGWESRIADLAGRAREASYELALTSRAAKDEALLAMADRLHAD